MGVGVGVGPDWVLERDFFQLGWDSDRMLTGLDGWMVWYGCSMDVWMEEGR